MELVSAFGFTDSFGFFILIITSFDFSKTDRAFCVHAIHDVSEFGFLS